MEEDTEYKKLPVDERCVHKLWKARVDGYEEAGKLFRTIDDEKGPEWNKYMGLVKKFVADTNVMAQEKGLEATLIFVENCGNAGKTVGEVISGIILKCMGSPKAKTKDLAVQITLMYIEIERHETVLEELLKGTDQKNPKIVATCISTMTQALREFGTKVVTVKPIVKKLPVLLSDRDKTVREEAKSLTIEMYRWIGPAFKTQIASLPQVMLTELEGEFDKVKNDKGIPTRYLRSQQEKQAAIAAVATNECDGDGSGNADEADDAEEIDPMDLIDPVDILSKLPKDFYEKLEAKKWQERKESIEALEPLLANPKLQSGDYGDLVRALKKVITKDTNVVLVAMAGKCLAALAKGLAKKFQPYGISCVQGILEKFKEKKANVVAALREAIDAIYPAISLEVIQEDLIEALNNKNPAVKSETASFIARSLTKTQPSVLSKKLLKALITALLKTLNESDPVVRDSAADAIGTLCKLCGDKAIAPYLSEVDALKQAKIKEFTEKAVITVKIVGAKKERPATAPAKPPAAPKGGSIEPKPVTRPQTSAGGAKKAGGIKKSASSNNNASGGAKQAGSAKAALPTERDLTPEEVDERAAELLPPDVCSGLVDSNWKNRLSAVESFQNTIPDIEAGQGVSQVLIRTIAKKPGLKDNNFQVLKIRLMIIQQIAERFGMTATTAEYILNDIAEKLGDPKNGAAAALALQSIVDAVKLEWVMGRVMSFAFDQKSPKVQQEVLCWANQAIKDYGFQVNAKQLLEDVRKAVQSVNPAVRSSGISLLGTMYLYMGNTLTMFFDSEKPALKQQIMQEFEKYAGQKAPPPSRGVSKSSSKASFGNDDDSNDMEEDGEPEPVNVSDIIPRVDISGQITEALLNEIADKNWKTRNEGLEKVKSFINEAKLIKSSLGDLPQALAQRLIDSNAKIAQTALEIGQLLATAMGPPCRIHVTTLFPGFFKSLGDSKAYIRTAGITCINVWCDQCGYKEVFSSEMIADALKAGSPALKAELWGWLSEKLPNIPTKTIQKEELIATLPYLYACLIDRSAEVRKNAGEAVLGIMIHIGYDAMMKVCEKQKPASRKDIQAALDKARPNLPVKPLPKGKQQAPILEDAPKSIKTGAARGQKAAVSKPGAAPSRSKKEEEVDLSPLLAINNTKSQRFIDEQKLKVLKWSFTTPREEFIDLLKDQMTTANVNKGLMANMFHDDFRYHLKVIESLSDDLNDNIRGLECNLDLVLKWISLRFYDTNPSVLLKGLEYLNQAFQILVENGYNMTENEGNCFIPHLLIKIGDPKDVVRNGVHSLLREICLVYPHTKIFSYLMDALKSKNARQRTECLDELGYLIEQYGITVCQPTPQAALKEIAKNISDRDNSVRNAALNTVVQAYFLAGDKIYKYIGQISEKDASMLEERIKRTKRPVKKAEAPAQKAIPMVVSQPEVEEEIEELPGEDELPSEGDMPPMNTRTYEIQPAQFTRPTGPFGLDPNVIEEIERDWIKSHQLKKSEFKQIDMSFMEKPLKTDERYPVSKLEKLMCHSSPQRTQNAGTVYNMSPLQGAQTTIRHHQQHQQSPQNHNVSLDRSNTITLPPRNDPTLTKLINNIASSDPTLAQAALIEMGDLLENKEKSILVKDFEVQYIDSILLQYKHLSKRPVSDALALYQPLLHSTYAFFLAPRLGKNLPVNSIKQIMSVLLGLMADNKLDGVDDPQYLKVINGICLKVLDATNFTNLNCALIRLLKETCSTSALPKFTELLMKCIWRNVKVLPERLDELDYDAVLSEINEFLIFLPSTWWQQRPSDTPLRTIRTIIHNMTKIKGNAILVHIQNISAASELHQYVLKVLKKEAQSGNLTENANPTTRSEKRLSRSTHEQVTNIFKLISDKETSQEGLSQLYDLKTKNPDVDIPSLLKGANPTFQKFITDGLAEIERERTGCDNRSGSDVTRPAAPDQWMERLNALKQKANMASKGTTEQMSHEMVDNKIADENLNMNQFQNAKPAANRAHPNVSQSRLSLLQEQLAKLKQGGPS